jgi:hypothetical protein
MKGNLIHRGNGDYKLFTEGVPYATTGGSPYKKLSKQNCDEIFGVVDVDKLADERFDKSTAELEYRNWAFKVGFNKAMELNKDKLFTRDDVISAIVHHTYLLHNDGKGYEDGDDNDDRIDYVIAALKQKPTEIEVEIEMKKVVDETKVIGAVKGVKGSGDKITTYKSVPKLDENGCLILKRI